VKARSLCVPEAVAVKPIAKLIEPLAAGGGPQGFLKALG
jgi:hypothetical protein